MPIRPSVRPCPSRVAALPSALCVLLAGGAAVGCNDACRDTAEVCDIRDEVCQRTIMAALSCLRGGDTQLPPVTLVSEDELAMQLAQRADPTPKEELAFERMNRGLALFELGSGDYDYEDATQDSVSDIAAVYFQDTKEIVVVDRGQPLRTQSAVATFAHELTHALQDAEYDLDKYRARWATDLDSSLAIRAVIEGEAVLYQLLVSAQLQERSPFAADWEEYFRRWRSEALESAERDTSPVTLASLRFPYAFGGGMVMQHWLAGGQKAVAALIDAPPLSTREVIFGKPSASSSVSGRGNLLERAMPKLGAAYAEVTTLSLGTWLARIYAARMGVDIDERFAIARANVDDVFVVQADAKRDVIVASWRVRLDDKVSPSRWPGMDHPAIDGWSDTKHNEAVLVASEVELEDADKLAWTSAGESDSQAKRNVATITLPAEDERLSGCRVRNPLLWVDPAAQSEETADARR